MLICVVAMKRHGDDNDDKQPDKRPRLYQVTWHTTLFSYIQHTVAKYTYALIDRLRRLNKA